MGITVDLCVPELNPGDAISRHTLLLRDLLNSRGVPARVIVERSQLANSKVVLAHKWRKRSSKVVLQHAIGSQLTQQIINRQVPVILNYHNITPSRFMDGWDSMLTEGIELGRDQLHQLVPLTTLAIAVSHYNARELKRMGFNDVVVCPILWRLETPISDKRPFVAQGEKRNTRLLFVGRIVPNKCHNDLIAALALLRSIRNDVNLMFVGAPSSPLYQQSLEDFAKKLKVDEHIVFAGKVTDAELSELYEMSDLFVCASEHEGFGVPLVEAMSHGLPVIAYDAAAVPEIIGESGIILKDKRPANIAAAIEFVLNDASVLEKLRHRGIQAAQKYDIGATELVMWEALKGHLDVKSMGDAAGSSRWVSENQTWPIGKRTEGDGTKP